jgi:hypothetical protein
MKSTKNQYIDLKEGKMSQANFMRSVRMNFPQYVTNVTSFDDTIKILKNKGILSETVIKESEVLSQAAQDENYDKVGTDGYDNVSETKSKAEEIADLKAEIKALMDSSSHQDPEIVSDKIDDIKAKIAKLKAEKTESLNEAVNDSGKQEYSKFSENTNDNFNELTDGISIEHECYPTKTYDEIVKIVTKNLKKDPFYYTIYKLTGIAGSKIETMDASKPETHQMKYVKGEESYVDKVRGMKPVKDVEKFKADKTKATKAKVKSVEVDVFSIVAKSQRGIPKMKPLGEKMKNVVVKDTAEKKKLKENVDAPHSIKADQGIDKSELNFLKKAYADRPTDKIPEKFKKIMQDLEDRIAAREKNEAMRFKDLPADPNKYKIVRDSKNYIIKATNADGVEFQKGDEATTHDGEKIKIVKFEESQGKVKAIYNKGMFFAGIDIDGLEAPKETMRPGVDMGKSFEKFKSKLAEMVRKAMSEMYDGRDNLDAENEVN